MVNTDRFPGIKGYYESRVEADLPCLPTIDQVEWLILEIERLRAANATLANRLEVISMGAGLDGEIGIAGDLDEIVNQLRGIGNGG